MVLCKFYAQGNCRFGENCKFEHQIKAGSNVDQNTLVRAVANDMVTAEKGSQWLLSCYAPFKEKPNFPGFEEHSFEEVRWNFYNAQNTGIINQFKQQFQTLLQTTAANVRALQNPSPDAVNIIVSIYNTPPNSGSLSSTFGGYTNSSSAGFRQANTFTSGNIFQQNQPSITKSIFANANQNLFGNNQQPQQNPIFGANQTNTTFGSNSASIFGASQGNAFASNQTATPFGSAQPNATFGSPPPPNSFGNTFGGNQNQTFGNAPSQGFGNVPNQGGSIFGLQQQQQNQTGYGVAPASTASGSIFGSPVQNSNQLFGTQPTASVYGSQVPPNTSPLFQQQTFSQQQNAFANQQNSVFGSTPQNSIYQSNAAYPSSASNTFGSESATQGSAFGSNVFNKNVQSDQTSNSSSFFGTSNTTVIANVDRNNYSKLEDLTPEEIKMFQKESFEFGAIPEKPPTFEMCF